MIGKDGIACVYICLCIIDKTSNILYFERELLHHLQWARQRRPPGEENFLTSTSHQTRKAKLKLKKGTGIRQSNPREELLNEELIGRAIWECLKNGDSEGVIEVIRIYTQMAKENAMARSTVRHSLKSNNPTVKTLAKLVQACT